MKTRFWIWAVALMLAMPLSVLSQTRKVHKTPNTEDDFKTLTIPFELFGKKMLKVFRNPQTITWKDKYGIEYGGEAYQVHARSSKIVGFTGAVYVVPSENAVVLKNATISISKQFLTANDVKATLVVSGKCTIKTNVINDPLPCAIYGGQGLTIMPATDNSKLIILQQGACGIMFRKGLTINVNTTITAAGSCILGMDKEPWLESDQPLCLSTGEQGGSVIAGVSSMYLGTIPKSMGRNGKDLIYKRKPGEFVDQDGHKVRKLEIGKSGRGKDYIAISMKSNDTKDWVLSERIKSLENMPKIAQ